MTDVPDSEWRSRAEALVSTLVERGDLVSQHWRAAFTATPRHLFVPRVLRLVDGGYRTLTGDGPGSREEWLSAVYSDDSLVTQHKPHAGGYRLPSGEPLHVPTSSSTMPSLMARMLETLDVRDEHRVLEIGTGTGYNAALLCHRLGDHAVASVDIDPDLVDTARDRLASLGYRPALVTGDGADGVAEHGPYDRIIATAAVPEIPTAWIKQLAPGGKILANVRGNLAGGTLCLLTKEDDDEVMGRFLPMGGHFMWLRSDVDNPHGPDEHPVEPVIDREGSRTTTRLDPVDLDDDGFRFLLQLALRRVRAIGRGRQPDPVDGGDREFVLLAGSDRSRAEVLIEPEPDGLRRVAQTGPRRLWDTVEATALLWHDLGRPTPDEFGLVANNDTQFVWLRHRDAWHRWPLPLV